MSDPAATPPDLPTDAQINAAMAADRAELRRLRRSISRAAKAGKPFDRNQRRMQRLLGESAKLRSRRLETRPEPAFEPGLPILAHRDAITAAIAEHPVVIVCGETGSGKSTQLPKLCLAAGRGVDGVIGHTQPRRIAARSVASRVAEELGVSLGESVGYKVRFGDQTSPATHIKLLTDGVLLAEAQGDALLSRYDTLILDEAHERSLNIDFLLGLLRRLVERRPELRVIITSATIDAERFAEHFARGERPAPIIESSGRGYPVEVRYRPPDGDDGDGFGAVCRDAVQAAAEIGAETSGDTLVFLPTERHIREAARLMRGVAPGAEVLPLYARLSSKEQQRVFQPGGKRRVVLATNVAESSVTVPNVTAVVDTGTARIARYASRTRVQRLPIEAISRASADQRAGRCGRVAPGVCVRLYSEEDYLARAEFPTAEVRRTNLAAVILRMKSLGLGEIEDFPLLDRPRPDAVREGRATLRELQATGDDGELTDLGKRLGRMPVDPRVGRMILAAAEEGCLAEVLVIAAALETQDPRERPADKQEAADASHARFADGRSDFLAYLNLWDHLRRQREELSRSAFRRGLAKQFLSYTRVMEWEDVHRQLLQVAQENGLRPGLRKDSYGAIHRALLTGLLTSIATLRDVKPGGGGPGAGDGRRERVEYQTPGGGGFTLWPGAGPAGSKPKWVVAAEVVETSRRYLRTVARIRPEWLPRLADHLIRREHNGPHWSTKRQTVVAHEKASLGGLVLPGRSLVPYGPIDPKVSRELFIREALVEGALDGEWDFIDHNAEVIGRVRDVGAKTRRADLLEDGTLLEEHYDQLIPADVWDARTFRAWRARAVSKNPQLLHLDESALLPEEAERDAGAFPDQMACGGQTLPLTYRLDGASEDDGVTVEAPAELLGLLDADALDWGVPGLLREKLVALIRLLPKAVRTRLVPAPDTADRVADALPFGEGRFAATVARAFSREAGDAVPTSALRIEELPAHLRMNVRVVDADGAVLGEGRDVAELRSRFATDESETQERTLPDARWTLDGLTEWSFGELPASVEVEHAGRRVVGMPGLVDQGDAVGVRLFVAAADAERSTRAGLRRLFLLQDEDKVRSQVKWLPEWDRLKKVLRRLDGSRDSAAEVAELIADRAIGEPDTWPRDAESFVRWRKQTRGRVPPVTHEATPIVVGVLDGLDAALDLLRRVEKDFRHPAADDVRRQIAELTPPGFFASTPAEWAGELPRYFRAIEARLRRIAEGGGAQDLRMRGDVEPRAERYRDAVAEDPRLAEDERGVRYRWMMEEFRVSTYAQRLGTRVKASAKRLDEAWDALMLG